MRRALRVLLVAALVAPLAFVRNSTRLVLLFVAALAWDIMKDRRGGPDVRR